MARSNAESAPGEPLRVPGWSEIPGLAHGFLGRSPSLPAGHFTLAALEGVLSAAGEEPRIVLALRQVHGARVLAPEDLEPTRAAWQAGPLPAPLPEGDALVGASAGVILTIRTADCVPVLLVAPHVRAVAAVHAGWRGMAAGVIANAIAALHARYGAGPSEIRAGIGPAIGACCYEFGAEHLSAFVAAFGRDARRAWGAAGARAGAADGELRVRLDLRLLARIALARAGVPPDAIALVGPCTAEHPQELHSYRRDGANAGRQVSYIGWRF